MPLTFIKATPITAEFGGLTNVSMAIISASATHKSDKIYALVTLKNKIHSIGQYPFLHRPQWLSTKIFVNENTVIFEGKLTNFKVIYMKYLSMKLNAAHKNALKLHF